MSIYLSELEKQKNWNHPQSPSVKNFVKNNYYYGILKIHFVFVHGHRIYS